MSFKDAKPFSEFDEEALEEPMHGNYFESILEAKEFAEELAALGLTEVRVDPEECAMYLRIPIDFSAAMAVAIANRHPDECDIEEHHDTDTLEDWDCIRLWWD
jgi:hypothetical protein